MYDSSYKKNMTSIFCSFRFARLRDVAAFLDVAISLQHIVRRTMHGFTGDFPSCGFKEGNPSRWRQPQRTRSCFLGTGCFWQSSDMALETAVRRLVYSAEAWAFALIHSDLDTRDEVMHSRDKRTEKSCEQATRMGSKQHCITISHIVIPAFIVKCSLVITPWNANKLPSTELSNKAPVRGFEKLGQSWWSFPYGSVKNRRLLVVRVDMLIVSTGTILSGDSSDSCEASNETMIFPRAINCTPACTRESNFPGVFLGRSFQ
jgi:hypothetical protein